MWVMERGVWVVACGCECTRTPQQATGVPCPGHCGVSGTVVQLGCKPTPDSLHRLRRFDSAAETHVSSSPLTVARSSGRKEGQQPSNAPLTDAATDS